MSDTGTYIRYLISLGSIIQMVRPGVDWFIARGPAGRR
jgi:hypothetical protein